MSERKCGTCGFSSAEAGAFASHECVGVLLLRIHHLRLDLATVTCERDDARRRHANALEELVDYGNRAEAAERELARFTEPRPGREKCVRHGLSWCADCAAAP